MRTFKPKPCGGCGENFTPRSASHARCDGCSAAKKKAYNLAYRAANRERLIEADRTRYTKEQIQAKTKLYLERHADVIKERKKAYYAKNRDRIIAKEAARYVEQAERIKQVQRAWRDANPDALRARSLRRRARKAGVPTEKYLPAEIFERDGWTCQICFEALNVEAAWPASDFPSIDHIVPLMHGGADVRENLQAAHLGCNLRKGRKVMADA